MKMKKLCKAFCGSRGSCVKSDKFLNLYLKAEAQGYISPISITHYG